MVKLPPEKDDRDEGGESAEGGGAGRWEEGEVD